MSGLHHLLNTPCVDCGRALDAAGLCGTCNMATRTGWATERAVYVSPDVSLELNPSIFPIAPISLVVDGCVAAISAMHGEGAVWDDTPDIDAIVGVALSADEARRLARALLTAADEMDAEIGEASA